MVSFTTERIFRDVLIARSNIQHGGLVGVMTHIMVDDATRAATFEDATDGAEEIIWRAIEDEKQ